MAKSVTVSLTESQAKFVAAKERFPLFCAGYNSGKSYVMGFCAVMDAMHSKHANVYIYEPEVSHIRTIAVPIVEYWLNMFGLKYNPYNKNERIIEVTSPNCGNFHFRPMDNPDTLVGYQSYSSHIDELDTIPTDRAEAVWRKILGRNRQQPEDVTMDNREWVEENQRWECINKIRVYTTPEGFKFCHRMWDPDGANAMQNPQYKLYKGRTLDNPTVSKAFIDELRAAFPPNLLQAYMEGEFVNLESGAVYTAFDRHRCFTPRVINKGDTLHIGCDFNVGKTAGVVFVDHEGKTSIVAEIINKYDTPDLIQEIKTRWPNHKVVMYPDASGVKRTTTNASSSDIALLKAAGFEVRAHGTNPRIKDRVAAVNKMFADGNLWINTVECPEVTKCLEQQAYDKNGDPDKKSGYDHPLDGLGYRIHYSFNIKRTMFQIPFSFAQKR